jgi:hypothetical protein
VLQSIEKTLEYQKRYFDTVSLTMEENKALKVDVVHLQGPRMNGTHCRPA